jgi:hypothetical protein
MKIRRLFLLKSGTQKKREPEVKSDKAESRSFGFSFLLSPDLSVF